MLEGSRGLRINGDRVTIDPSFGEGPYHPSLSVLSHLLTPSSRDQQTLTGVSQHKQLIQSLYSLLSMSVCRRRRYKFSIVYTFNQTIRTQDLLLSVSIPSKRVSVSLFGPKGWFTFLTFMFLIPQR